MSGGDNWNWIRPTRFIWRGVRETRLSGINRGGGGGERIEKAKTMHIKCSIDESLPIPDTDLERIISHPFCPAFLLLFSHSTRKSLVVESFYLELICLFISFEFAPSFFGINLDRDGINFNSITISTKADTSKRKNGNCIRHLGKRGTKGNGRNRQDFEKQLEGLRVQGGGAKNWARFLEEIEGMGRSHGFGQILPWRSRGLYSWRENQPKSIQEHDRGWNRGGHDA